MSKDHPLHLHFKMVLPEVTTYAYKNESMRVEVTINHELLSLWLMTVRILTLDRLSFVSDVLWKYPDTSALAVDMAFAHLVNDINEGMTPKKLAHQFFLNEWGCVILDDLPAALEN